MIRATALLILLLDVTPSCADPALAVKSGENHFTISVMNGWNRDIKGVSVSVNEASIPSWMSIKFSNCAFDVPIGQTGAFIIDVMLDESAPIGKLQTVVKIERFKESLPNRFPELQYRCVQRRMQPIKWPWPKLRMPAASPFLRDCPKTHTTYRPTTRI